MPGDNLRFSHQTALWRFAPAGRRGQVGWGHQHPREAHNPLDLVPSATVTTFGARRGTLLWPSRGSPRWQPIHWPAVVDVVVDLVVGQTAVPAVVPTVEPTVVPS